MIRLGGRDMLHIVDDVYSDGYTREWTHMFDTCWDEEDLRFRVDWRFYDTHISINISTLEGVIGIITAQWNVARY